MVAAVLYPLGGNPFCCTIACFRATRLAKLQRKISTFTERQHAVSRTLLLSH